MIRTLPEVKMKDISRDDKIVKRANARKKEEKSSKR